MEVRTVEGGRRARIWRATTLVSASCSNAPGAAGQTIDGTAPKKRTMQDVCDDRLVCHSECRHNTWPHPERSQIIHCEGHTLCFRSRPSTTPPELRNHLVCVRLAPRK